MSIAVSSQMQTSAWSKAVAEDGPQSSRVSPAATQCHTAPNNSSTTCATRKWTKMNLWLSWHHLMFSLCQGLTRGDLSVPSEPRNCRGDEATEEQRLQDLGGFLDHHSKRPCAPDGLQTRDASHDGALAAASWLQACLAMVPGLFRIVHVDVSNNRVTAGANSTNSQLWSALISFDQLCNMQATSNDGFVLVDSCRS